MLDYKLIVTVRESYDFDAQEECAIARLAINLKLRILIGLHVVSRDFSGEF